MRACLKIRMRSGARTGTDIHGRMCWKEDFNLLRVKTTLDSQFVKTNRHKQTSHFCDTREDRGLN